MKNDPKRFISDEYTELFRDEADFTKEVCEIEDQGRWFTAGTPDLGIKAVERGDNRSLPMDIQKTLDALAPGIAVDAALDTIQNGSQLFLESADGLIPIRTVSIADLMESAVGIRSAFLGSDIEKDPGFFGAVFDAAKTRLNRQKRMNKLWVCAGKLTACGTNEYLIMRMDKVFEQIIPELRNRFGDLEFVEGVTSHPVVRAIYRISGKTESAGLWNEYQQMVKQMGVKDTLLHDPRRITFDVTIQTSNTKNSAATCRAVVEIEDARVPVGTPISVAHRGNKDGVAALAGRIPELFAKFGEKESSVARLMGHMLNYPADAVINMGKKLGIQMPLLTKAAEELSDTLDMRGEDRCTAWDAYVFLCRVINIAAGDYSPAEICKIEEACARALRRSWRDEDSPIKKTVISESAPAPAIL